MEPTQSIPELIPAEPPASAPRGPRGRFAVAAVWHTVLLISILLAFSFLGAKSQHKFSAAHGRMLLYGMTIGWEWLIVGYIYLGTRRRTSLRDLAGGRWSSVEEVLLDMALGVGFWVLAMLVLAGLAAAMGMAHANQIAETKQKLSFMVPQNGVELALFLGLSATAGICEEIIFRGYLQRQFAALTRSVAGGLVLQALVFGAGHGYEGGKRMVLIGAYGALFAALALARNSLRPGMLAHFLHDATAGIALQKLLR